MSTSSPAGSTVATAEPASVARRILTAAWLSILLGLAIEVVLLAMQAGFGQRIGLEPALADTVQKVSWSFLVCVGIACGSAATKLREQWMGLAGLFGAPLAFAVSRALHKSAQQALALGAGAVSGPSIYRIASVKGLEYAVLGIAIAVLGRRSAGLIAHLLTGLVVGLAFGGYLVRMMVEAASPPLATPALCARVVNELLFPIGCSFVLYVTHAVARLARAGARAA